MSAPRRLAYLIDTRKTGGAQRQLAGLLAHLPAACERTVYVWQETPEALGRVDFPRARLRLLGGGSMLRARGWLAFLRLVRHLRRDPPDCLHATLGTANLVAPVAGALSGVPVLTSRRDLGDWMRPRHRWLARRIAPRAAAVIANAEAVKQAAATLEGLPPKRIHVIPNGVDLPPALPGSERAAIRSALGASPEETVVVQVATLTRVKDHATALRAAERLRSAGVAFRWWMVGEGPLRRALEAEAAARGLGERVRFPGSRSDVPALLAAGDVAVLTSRSEGFPNAVLEAMAAGRPVVATDVGGTAEAVRPERTGLLVPPGDGEALAEALRRCADDPALRRRLGDAGRERARSEYGWDALTERMLSVYGAVLRSGRAGSPAGAGADPRADRPPPRARRG